MLWRQFPNWLPDCHIAQNNDNMIAIRSNFLTEAPGQYTGGMQMQGQGQMM